MDNNFGSDDDVYFDSHTNALVTRCTKCHAKISLRLQGPMDSPVIKDALRRVLNRVGMCPINEDGSFPPNAHPELSFWGFWQGDKLMKLIDLLVETGVFNHVEPVQPS